MAHALVQEKGACCQALALLLVGPQLFAAVDIQALEDQARQVGLNPYAKKSERSLSHPLLLRRYARIAQKSTG